MKMFNFRAKVKIVGSIFFVAILLSVVVLGGTRIISDSSDNIKTFITNSNGGVWDATGNNIQLALNDVGNDSSWVDIGSNGYTITSHLSIWNNTNFYLHDSTITLGNATNDEIINIGYKPGAGATHNGMHNILIEGGTLDGNNGSQTFSQYNVGIMICSDSSNITIRDMTIINTCGCGIRMLRQVGETIPMTNITIEDSYFGAIQRQSGQYWGGVQVSGKYCTVQNSKFHDNFACGIILQDANFGLVDFNKIIGNTITGYVSVGIWMEGNQASNNTIRDNDILNINSSAYTPVSFYSRGMTITDGNIISGNKIYGVSEFAFHVAGNGNIFTDNKVRDVGGDGLNANSGDAIFLAGVLEKNKFSNNDFTNFNRYGCTVDSNNEFINNYFEGGSRGLSISSVNNVTVDNNKFIGQSSDGIMMYNAKSCHITDNKIFSNGDGIQCTGTSSDCNTITGNDLQFSNTPANIDIVTANRNSLIKDNPGYSYSYPNHFGDTTNYVDVNETGYLTLHGDARIERHADINAGSWIKKGLADPGTSTEGLFCTLDFDKAINETVYYTFHIPWRRCENTDMEVQVYWFHDNNAADANKKVMWGFDYVSIEPGEIVDAVNTSITQLSAGNHNTDAGKLVSTTFTAKIVAGNLANHDTMGLRFYRVGTATGDDLNEDARLISVHLHFTMDKLGEPIG